MSTSSQTVCAYCSGRMASSGVHRALPGGGPAVAGKRSSSPELPVRIL